MKHRSFEKGGSLRIARSARHLLPLALVVVSSGCHSGARHPWKGRAVTGPVRAVWVTRWDFKSPRDIGVVMENARQAGFNTVLFQVRGGGTALYRSKLEPWADELGGRDPGFDPLTVACHEGHRRGLSVHAWMNVMPGWFGEKPPSNSQQLYVARADWFLRDAQGRRQPLSWYSSVNPCYPEVRRYLTDVAREIASGYPIDGLHLDYIRFPNEWHKGYGEGASVPDYPRDPRTLQMFRAATGKTPDEAPGAWNDWRTAQVTQLVRDIRAMMQKVNKGAALTVAVGSDPQLHLRNHFQDSRRWMGEGLVDAVFPMNYDSDLQGYGRTLDRWRSMKAGKPVITGVMFDKRDARLVSQQVSQARDVNKHFAAFAYNSMFERLDAGGRPIMDAQSPSRAELRRQIIPQMRRLAGLR